MRKIIVCPDCGNEFESPRMDSKSFGIGPTLPGLGHVKCPSCGTKHRRSDFAPVEE